MHNLAAAVHGLGGVGKSELALQYAAGTLDQYCLVWWVTADTRQNVEAGLTDLTRQLHPVATLAEAADWAMGRLQSHTGWLLILDNVERLPDVDRLLGSARGRGHVLLTTRRDVGTAMWRRAGLARHPLRVLDRTASVTLLRRLTSDEPDDRPDDGAGVLAADLRDLPRCSNRRPRMSRTTTA
ncbi:hypothetical protein AB0J72_34845 [Dactylosporangium sp. NPDC049742]|uniref:hypothetical protein n=1 Tax=Dactylosporangium sp. NPDC049742 TaxID=3154737 RepID=UPI0034297B6B